MSSISSHSMPPRPAGKLLQIAAAASLLCALAPILALTSIVPWSEPIVLAPYAAAVPAAGVLVHPRRRLARRQRLVAPTTIAVVGMWVLLLVAFGLVLRFG
jgi:hypothetical protein